MRPHYEHNGLYMRILEASDLDILREHRNDHETWHHLTSTTPISRASQELWFHNLSLDRSKVCFIAGRTSSGDCGFIRMDEIDHVNRSVRVGLDIFLDHRGQGLAAPVMRMVCRYGFEVMNMHRLWLLVAKDNKAAEKAYSNAGFTVEGIQRDAILRGGSYHDYTSMSLLEGGGM